MQGGHMNEQKRLITEFKSVYGDITYREIGARMNLQTTRVFRIMNGHEMKLSEYVKMKSLIRLRKPSYQSLVHYLDGNISFLSEKDLYNIKRFIYRKCEIRKLSKIFSQDLKEVS